MIGTYNNFLNVAVGVVGNSVESRRVEVRVDEAKSVAQWLNGCFILIFLFSRFAIFDWDKTHYD